MKCPSCRSEASYKYGKAWTGKQRFLCLICGRQYTFPATRAEIQGRPECAVCGRVMHLYKNEPAALRFRCSGYPACRTFKKVVLPGKLSAWRDKFRLIILPAS